jgi:hypothetical protein
MHGKKNRLKKKLDGLEAKMVAEAFERNGWRLGLTAESLGMPLSTLQYIVKRNTKLEKAYKKHGHGRGRPFGKRKPV